MELESWVGREETSEDRIDARPAAALAATLDLDPEAALAPGELPPLWHWVYFTPRTRRSGLGEDGHARRGGFLPPVDLPSRMWAGGRLVFHRPLHIGEVAHRRSRILRCEAREGRSGPLVFVTVRHLVSGEAGLAIGEEHDIVYRTRIARDAPPAGEPAPTQAAFRRSWRPDPVLLFRYSALTFNGHRIHYDHPYATQVEGYPGLVVHGPLIATLLMETFRAARPLARASRFDYRALGPLYDTEAFDACVEITAAGGGRLWADCAGRMTMKAEVGFAEPS